MEGREASWQERNRDCLAGKGLVVMVKGCFRLEEFRKTVSVAGTGLVGVRTGIEYVVCKICNNVQVDLA